MSALRELLDSAAHHPWYQGSNGGPCLADWPILTKSELNRRLATLRREPDGLGGIYFSRSGGTTGGKPVYVPADIAENHEQRRRLARWLAIDNIFTPRTVALNIAPMVRMYRTLEIFDEFCERCGSTVLPMAAIAEDAEIFELATLFGANTLLGMPSRLLAFARSVQDNHWSCPIEAVVFGGEPLQLGKRRFLSDVLGTKRFSGIYGSAELGTVAWQPDASGQPVYRFPKDILHIEIVEPDADGFGALVATNLIRRRFPLVRYQTGDVGRVVAEHDETVGIELRGRQKDSFLIGDDFHVLADFADLLQGFEEFQIQLGFDERLHKDVIRFCLNAGNLQPNPQERSNLIERINDRLGNREGLYITKIAFVGAEGLVRTRETHKTPAIVDFRGREECLADVGCSTGAESHS
jgi:phenylacetate-CoA ligase